MQNRVDKTLTPTDIQDISDAVKAIHDKISTGRALTPDEQKKGGWYLGPNAIVLLEKTLVQAKLHPANFPSIDIAAFERDITLIKQLRTIESQIKNLQNIANDNRRLLTKDAAEQGFYVYKILKVMYDVGVPDGAVYPQLKPYMPRSGKKTGSAKK